MAGTNTTRRSLLTTTLAGLAFALPGCKKKPGVSEPKDAIEKVTLIVHSAKNSNRVRPLYVLVRELNRKSFVEDDYSKIARLVVEPDETVIQTFIVLPNENQVVSLTPKTNEPEALGIYGLFTTGTGESWKILAERPRKIEVWISESALERPLVVERAAPVGK